MAYNLKELRADVEDLFSPLAGIAMLWSPEYPGDEPEMLRIAPYGRTYQPCSFVRPAKKEERAPRKPRPRKPPRPKKTREVLLAEKRERHNRWWAAQPIEKRREIFKARKPLTPEQREVRRAREREAYAAKKRPGGKETPEALKARKAAWWAGLTEAEKEAFRARRREQRANASEEARQKARERQAKYRARQRG